MIWEMLDQISEHIFLWNVFPLHPFSKDRAFSNRAHNASERDQGMIIMKMLADFLQPRRIVAIGNDAAKVTQIHFSGADIINARHPSYGGQKEFRKNISCAYSFQREKHQSSFVF